MIMDEIQSARGLDSQESEIDLREILYKVFSIRKALFRAAAIGFILGIVVGFSVPRKYSVQVTLSPEMGNTKPGGLSDIAASFLGSEGLKNDGLGALNASLSSDIVSSTPFLLELLAIRVPASPEEVLPLEAYLERERAPWWSYIMKAPGLVISGIKSLFVKEKEVVSGDILHVISLSEEQAEMLKSLRKSISANMDKKTGVTTIAVSSQEPVVAAVLADSVVRKLQARIIDYRTSKAKEDCDYLEMLFENRRAEYYAAQKLYADYVDSHDRIILQSVRVEQERLQNDMNLAFQVYNQVANQLQMARAKIQEEKPVFAVVEPAVIPLEPSGMGKSMYAVVFVFLVVAGVAAWLLFGKNLWMELKNMQSQES
jgi:uncharacterized protein involved in exopolysaccharide biosynthesis